MSNRTDFDFRETSAMERLTQLGTGAAALVVGARQMLNAIDVHPSQLLTSDRTIELRESALEAVDDVRKSKRLKRARGSANDAATSARDRIVVIKNSDAAKSAGKAVAVIGTQALKSKTTRRTARKALPFMMRRGFLAVTVGSAIFVVGRIVLRRVKQHRLEGLSSKQLSSGERNADLARRSDAAVAKNVNAPMPSAGQKTAANGARTTVPFPR